MPEYRRFDAPGGTFFLTLVTYGRRPLFRDADNVARLRAALSDVQQRRPLVVHGAVVLPDHLHFLWELPKHDADFSTRVGLLKVGFTRSLGAAGQRASASPSRRRHHERDVWQRRFWEHTIRDEDDFGIHLDYIHYNPVKHGLACCPHAWPYSSFHQWVQREVYEADWCCGCRRAARVPAGLDAIASRTGE